MRITRALLPVAAVALALSTPAAGGRAGLTIHGWVVPTTTAAKPAPAGKIVPLALLPLNLGYSWAQPTPLAVTALTPLTLDQLPILTTYPWAQPDTTPQSVPYGEPWSL